MPPGVMFALGLLGVLAVLARRVLKPRGGFTTFLRESREKDARTHESIRHANAAITHADALRPVLASLADMELPPGFSLETEPLAANMNSARARIRAITPEGRRDLLLTHTRSSAQKPNETASRWIVAEMSDTETSQPLREETFHDMAACARRLQHLILRRD